MRVPRLARHQVPKLAQHLVPKLARHLALKMVHMQVLNMVLLKAPLKDCCNSNSKPRGNLLRHRSLRRDRDRRSHDDDGDDGDVVSTNVRDRQDWPCYLYSSIPLCWYLQYLQHYFHLSNDSFSFPFQKGAELLYGELEISLVVS